MWSGVRVTWNKTMKYTPADIQTLEPNEVFVFGSNRAGRHGLGAALTAVRRFGAIEGQGEGSMGRCYAIPTKGFTLKTLPLVMIESHIVRFLMYADSHPDEQFLVTPIGCGLAGFEPRQIAPLFFNYRIPPNVALPKSFWQWADTNNVERKV